MDPNPFAPPTAIVADMPLSALGDADTPFFPVSTTKLFVLSLCTMGFYQVYWFYKNWRLIKEREQSDIWPAPRAVFSIFFCYPCFKKMREFKGPLSADATLAAGPLATGWIVLSLLHKLPEPYWLISLLAVVFLLPVQSYANRINAVHYPDHDPNSRFTLWNWIAMGLGIIILILCIIGLMMP